MTKPCGVRSPDDVWQCALPANHAPTIHASHRFEDKTWNIWPDGARTYSRPPRDSMQLRHCLLCQWEWIGPLGGSCNVCGDPGKQGPLGWPAYHASEYGLSFRTTPAAMADELEVCRRARWPWWRRWRESLATWWHAPR